jgi:chemotaxis protein methyltransferase CheR
MTVPAARYSDTSDTEIDALLVGIRKCHGYDFTHYSRASLYRRIAHARGLARAPDYATFLDRLVSDESCFDEFLRTLSITVTEMFRDPPFYRVVREQIVPMLKTYPFVKIWHAGCATGEEVYSMAILLHEEGFLDRVRIYATDFNKQALKRAYQGVFPLKNLRAYSENYALAGGTHTLFDYFNVSYDFAKIAAFLKRSITFAYHNLVTDGVFAEMNMICCRNVLIYFDRTLQNHVLSMFANSMRYGSYLCLGTKETLNFTAVRPQFDIIDLKQKIYRKNEMICNPCVYP